MKHLISIILACFVLSLNAQIWSNPITGINPSSSNPYTTGDIVSNGIVVSGIGIGSGPTAQIGIDRYNARKWNSNSLNLNDYFNFTITPSVASGSISFANFLFTAQISSTGPTNFVIRSSVDNYTSNITTTINTSSTGAANVIDLSPFANITSQITFRIYAWGGSNANGTFSINDFSFGGVLPIKLLSQKLLIENKNIKLNWTTEEEINHSHFIIEHSSDGIIFSVIGQISENLDRSGIKEYSFTHPNPTAGYNYYRLVQVDLDGKKTTFDVLAIDYKSGGEKYLFPSHVQSNIWLNGYVNGNAIIFDNLGRKVQNSNYNLGDAIDVSNLQAGTYFLSIDGESHIFYKQ